VGRRIKRKKGKEESCLRPDHD